MCFSVIVEFCWSICCWQALLAILDSTLNKAEQLKGLYVHMEKNVLIQINPHIRIPRIKPYNPNPNLLQVYNDIAWLIKP